MPSVAVVAKCQLRIGVHAVDGGLDIAAAGAARQRWQIDMTLPETVMAGDQPWQHAGVGGVSGWIDQRDLYVGDGLTREAPYHLNVTVASADKQQSLHRVCSGQSENTMSPYQARLRSPVSSLSLASARPVMRGTGSPNALR